ncbi:hypothetical protein Tco_1016366 [Tanacetum coccineum]|uniref:Uncharacterized protein n=1 Tax=Tanacetum coccineum TaxID=301880 RepID=A0ABQ5FNE8_9ASTR
MRGVNIIVRFFDAMEAASDSGTVPTKGTASTVRGIPRAHPTRPGLCYTWRVGEFPALEFREFSLSLWIFLELSLKSSLALGMASASFSVFSLTVAMMRVTLAIALIVSESGS